MIDCSWLALEVSCLDCHPGDQDRLAPGFTAHPSVITLQTVSALHYIVSVVVHNKLLLFRSDISDELRARATVVPSSTNKEDCSMPEASSTAAGGCTGCHLSEAVRDSRRRKKVDTAVIPGGCTGLIQAPDVSWNRPFKSHLRNQYDEWLLSGEKTYTAAGNLRVVSKTTLCDMVVKAWESISSTLIVKSFQCCGLLPNPSIGDITCFKDGRPAAAGRDQLREAMEAPLSGNTVPPAATCESDDLDHGAVFLEEAEPVDQDGGCSSTIDCSDEAEGE